jgi:hypothetical protein
MQDHRLITEIANRPRVGAVLAAVRLRAGSARIESATASELAPVQNKATGLWDAGA